MKRRSFLIGLSIFIALALLGSVDCPASPYNYFTLMDGNGDGVISTFNISNNSSEGVIAYWLDGGWHNLASGQMATYHNLASDSRLDVRYFLDGVWHELWKPETLVVSSPTSIMINWNVGDPSLVHGSLSLVSNVELTSSHLGDTPGVPGNPVPLPPSAILLGSGLLGLIAIEIRKRRESS